MNEEAVCTKRRCGRAGVVEAVSQQQQHKCAGEQGHVAAEGTGSGSAALSGSALGEAHVLVMSVALIPASPAYSASVAVCEGRRGGSGRARTTREGAGRARLVRGAGGPHLQRRLPTPLLTPIYTLFFVTACGQVHTHSWDERVCVEATGSTYLTPI